MAARKTGATHDQPGGPNEDQGAPAQQVEGQGRQGNRSRVRPALPLVAPPSVRKLGELTPVNETVVPTKQHGYGCRFCKFYQFVSGADLTDWKGTPVKGVDHVCGTWGVKARGSKHPTILFVGEGPGSREDQLGTAFVGPSGKLLDFAINETGVAGFKYRISNCTRCWAWQAGGKQKTPTVAEATPCSGFLGAEIAACDPLVIVPLGALALHVVTGDTDLRITEVQGRLLEYKVAGKLRWIIPLLHPAAILRNDFLMDGYYDQFETLAGLTEQITRTGMGGERKMPEAVVIADPDDAISAIRTIRSERKLVAYDVETRIGYRRKNKRQNLTPCTSGALIVLFGIANDPNRGFSIAIEHPDAPAMDARRQEVIAELKALLTDPDLPKVAQNKKFDNQVIKELWGFEVGGQVDDTMHMHYCLDEKPPHSLDALSWKYTRMGGYKHEIERVEIEADFDFTKIPLALCGPYNAHDVCCTLQVHAALEEELLKNPQLHLIAHTFLSRVSDVLRDMELNGLRINTEIADDLRLKALRKEIEALDEILKVPRLKRWIVRRVAKDPKFLFKPNSTNQLRRILFKLFGYEVREKTKTGLASTAKQTLIYLAYKKNSRFCKLLLDHRAWSKARGTFIEAFLHDAQHCRGFLHGHFNESRTSTIRLASESPNLQNLSGRGELADVKRMIESRFLPLTTSSMLLELLRTTPVADWARDLGIILLWDYSQIELRVAAALSRDKEMLRIYRNDGDIHTETMCTAYSMTPEEAAKLEKENPSEHKIRRTVSKRLNFGAVYQIGPDGILNILAKEVPPIYLAEEEAAERLDIFFKKYRGIRKWVDRSNDLIRSEKSIRTVFGWMRRLPAVASLDPKTVNEALREGTNARVQSAAATLALTAMVIIYDEIRARGLKALPILNVHDSLGYDTQWSDVVELAQLCREVAEHLPDCGHRVWGRDFDWGWLKALPVKIDIEVGPNYRDLEKVKGELTRENIAAAYLKAVGKMATKDLELRDFVRGWRERLER